MEEACGECSFRVLETRVGWGCFCKAFRKFCKHCRIFRTPCVFVGVRGWFFVSNRCMVASGMRQCWYLVGKCQKVCLGKGYLYNKIKRARERGCEHSPFKERVQRNAIWCFSRRLSGSRCVGKGWWIIQKLEWENKKALQVMLHEMFRSNLPLLVFVDGSGEKSLIL